MTGFAKYDDAGWHYGGTFPKGEPAENGGVHIGVFLRWCILKSWTGELHLEEWPEDVEKVETGEWTGTEFLFKVCDQKFTSEELNDNGNAFALAYYQGEADAGKLSYFNDYTEIVDELQYRVSELEVDRDMIDRVIAHRFANYTNGGNPFRTADGVLESPSQVLSHLKRG